jgi:hypothetical protein
VGDESTKGMKERKKGVRSEGAKDILPDEFQFVRDSRQYAAYCCTAKQLLLLL